MSIIKIPLDKHYDGVVHDALMNHFDNIHDDDAPYIEESITYTLTRSGKILRLEIDDDPPLNKPSEPPNPTLKPLSRKLRYTFLRVMRHS